MFYSSTKCGRSLRLIFLKSYIQENIDRRKNDKTQLRKNQWKEANNIIYGKSIQNLRKIRTKSYLCNNGRKLRRHIRSPYFKRTISLGDSENIIAEKCLRKFYFTTPFILDTAFFQHSKVFMDLGLKRPVNSPLFLIFFNVPRKLFLKVWILLK